MGVSQVNADKSMLRNPVEEAKHLEGFEQGGYEFVLTKDSGIIAIPLVNPRPYVSLQNARVITQAPVRARFSTKRAAKRTEVDGQVCERTRHDVATTHPSGELDVPTRDTLRGSDDSAVVWDVLPVAAKAVRVAVEDGRVLGGVLVFRPVPVLSQFRYTD